MRTAISVGALALTLGGVLLAVAPAPVSAVTQAGDCEGGGLLGGVTGGLCEAVGVLGNTVSATANDTVSDTVSDAVGGTLLGGVVVDDTVNVTMSTTAGTTVSDTAGGPPDDTMSAAPGGAMSSATSGPANGPAGGPSPGVEGYGYGQNAETPPHTEKAGKSKKDDNAKKGDKIGKAQSGADVLDAESVLDQPQPSVLPETVPEILVTPWGEDTADVQDVPDIQDPADNDVLPSQNPGGACSPLSDSPGCAGTSANPAHKTTPSPHASPSPRPSHAGGTVPAEEATRRQAGEQARPPQTRRRVAETDGGGERGGRRGEATGSETPPPTVDAEAPRLELLWPAGPVMRRFQRAVTPTKTPDPLGTAFTAVLLLAAILAVRLLYVRRIGEKSIPLEPLRMKRHRTA
ncbi:hypothetical protein ABZ470_31025 [Streptosporangium sp. NPDC020072]|uniref:hypothetical protein n=1 Tax=Streptosporangium sp. NPDC020072 TaxID=3154788 RepID=UPI0034195030